MEETISLKEIFQTLRKRIWLIAVITFLAVAASAIGTYFLMTPQYEASTQILVNQADAKNATIYSNTNTVQTNVQLVSTYSDIINNPSVLNPVINKLHLELKPNQLKSMLSVGTSQNSQVFSLTAKTDSPSEAVRIVNQVALAFKSRVQKVMNVDNVSILSPATISASSAPVSPKPMINLAIGLVVGLMISIGLAFLLDYLDSSIKTEEDIEKYLELPVLGVVSEIKKHEAKNARSTSRTHSRTRAKGFEGGGHFEAK
ncbi:YveK family protein [Sporolactobacillus kofuensis]|uniref:YveK family protein n=1 Tax=Sporolactobacillus kofuensis TaxID=269672 RepID=A0ABW1WKX9_9BACL|nr:Wzz/FepE/Etk N-terminal domain-containing protein [Sporolactobacillus kofuensis]MCO7177086.1 Wzz/FepE/Etk N-terminal domain-containing protein [Sporolactobacillus kofuensis]